MGVQLADLIEKNTIKLDTLSGRKISIDAYNTLYQFLSTIRQFDGTPLKDSEGRTTSHLSGLLYRTVKLLELGIKPAYVFDGKPPDIKHKTIQERVKIREEQKKKWDLALQEGNMEKAKTHAQGSVRLTREMVEESKELLTYMGIPIVQAPSEGEAQAAYMAIKGDVWASASQDFDSLLFGSPYLIRNLTITGRRKLPGKPIYVDIETELIELGPFLNSLGIERKDLIEMGIMIGTDYNKGVKGIGPKKALALVKEGKKAEDVYDDKKIDEETDLQKLRNFFMEPPLNDDYVLEWKAADDEKMIDFLVHKHDFSIDRVKNAINKMEKASKEIGTQSRIEQWF